MSLFPGGCCYLQAVAVERAQDKGILAPCMLSCFLLSIGASINRGYIRERYLIDGSFLNDCLVWTFCTSCAATQEYREVNRREGI